MVDYKILEGATCYGGRIPDDLGHSAPDHVNHDSADLRYCCEALGLFYVNKSGHLMPIAIQLRQQPGPENPIWTPNEPNEHDWMLAKLWLRVADANVHQVSKYLCQIRGIDNSNDGFNKFGFICLYLLKIVTVDLSRLW